MQLDAVVELAVDENALIRRMEKRVAETKARGEEVRADDNVEAFSQRLATYRQQTAPVSEYYKSVGELHRVDGMASIDDVTRAIDHLLKAKQPA